MEETCGPSLRQIQGVSFAWSLRQTTTNVMIDQDGKRGPGLEKRPEGLHWKDRVRSRFAPALSRFARRFGFSWETLGRTKLSRDVLVAQLNSMDPPRAVSPVRQPLDVIFTSMVGANQHLMAVDVVLARALQARGHRVKFVLCDQALPACEAKAANVEEEWQVRCARCFSFGLNLLNAAGADILFASDLIDETDAVQDWSAHVEAALLKHFRVGRLANDDYVEQRRKIFRQAAAMSERIGKALVRLRPDRIVMTHGIYSTWGPMRERLLQAGIPLVSSAEGKKKDSIKFNWSTSADWWDVSEEWERVKDVPLTLDQERRIDEYLQSRRSHERDARVYNFGPEETVEQSRRRLRLDADKPTFILFTNVLWDAASAHREIAFADPIDWVLKTIAWFATRPERQLVVKVHPAEIVIGTNQPFTAILEHEFPDLPGNVRIVRPDEKVNSWSMMRMADLGLVHTSTVGMEIPLEGIPCAVVSRTHFREKGFTIDVSTQEEYFQLLEQWPQEVDRERLMTLAKRYAFLTHERYQLPFPFLIEPKSYQPVAFQHLDEETLLSHPTIKIFLDGIEQQHEFLLPND